MRFAHELTANLSRWLAWLAGAVILFGCAVPISIDVVSRAVFGGTVLESFEFSTYALAACIGLGMGYTVTSRANIRVDILTAKLPVRARLAVDLLASITLAVTALAFAYYAFDVLSESWRLSARSQSTMQVPLIIPQSIWWIGLFWFATIACLTPLFAIGRLWAGDISSAQGMISNPVLSDEMAEIGIDATGPDTR